MSGRASQKLSRVDQHSILYDYPSLAGFLGQTERLRCARVAARVKYLKFWRNFGEISSAERARAL